MNKKVDEAWEKRLGRGTAILLRRRRRARTLAIFGGTAGMCFGVAGVGWAASTGTGQVGPTVLFGVTALCLFAVAGLVLSIVLGLNSRQLRFQSEGAALSVLLPNNGTITASVISPHLRSITDFDDWARLSALAPATMGAKMPQWAWRPGPLRPLASGATAFILRRASLRVGAATILVAGVMALVLVADHGPALVARWAGGSAAAILVVCSALLRIAAETRAVAEYKAGYTTLTPIRRTGVRGAGFEESDMRLGVDLVDPSSGAILRAAGAKGITAAECERRRVLVRNTRPTQA